MKMKLKLKIIEKEIKQKNKLYICIFFKKIKKLTPLNNKQSTK